MRIALDQFFETKRNYKLESLEMSRDTEPVQVTKSAKRTRTHIEAVVLKPVADSSLGLYELQIFDPVPVFNRQYVAMFSRDDGPSDKELSLSVKSPSVSLRVMISPNSPLPR